MRSLQARHPSRIRTTLAALTAAATVCAAAGCSESADTLSLEDSPECRAISGSPKGTGPGSDSTQIGVIAAFKHAILTERDAGAAVSYTRPESDITTAAVRDAIAEHPAGVSYCFGVTRVEGNAVWVTTYASHPRQEYRPGYQIIITNGEAPYRITAIYDRYQGG